MIELRRMIDRDRTGAVSGDAVNLQFRRLALASELDLVACLEPDAFGAFRREVGQDVTGSGFYDEPMRENIGDLAGGLSVFVRHGSFPFKRRGKEGPDASRP